VLRAGHVKRNLVRPLRAAGGWPASGGPLLRPEDGAWVVELVAPEGFLWQRRHRVSSPAEYAECVPITRPYFEAEPETTVEAFEAAAAPHPVFRIGEALVPVCRAATVSGP
jgi:hypothetical protein